MCPNSQRIGRLGLRKQRGFLMPLAVFIIVVMGGLAIVMARNISQSTTSTVQAAVAIQAFYAADSGAQWGMNQLFYDTGAALIRTQVDSQCTNLNGQNLTFSASGLSNCDTQLSCSSATDPSNVTSYYLISSAADCGDAVIGSQRTVEVSAMMR